MNNIRKSLCLLLIAFFACNNPPKETHDAPRETIPPKDIVNADYELFIPQIQEHLLILFPCFPCDAVNTQNEFAILDRAIENNVAVLYMNFNQRLWLTEAEKNQIESIILKATEENQLNTQNTFIGGFSSGGNVSLLMSDYLKETKSSIQPNGVFIADSPIDLYALYQNANRTIEKNFSEIAIQEANWIIARLDEAFGVGDSSLTHFEDHSPYMSLTQTTRNLSHLNDVDVRLYTEPDTAWWSENRHSTYEDMNACYIEKMANDLSKLYGEDKIELIFTTTRGYRANGERHPHSWSIIEGKGLIDWVKAN